VRIAFQCSTALNEQDEKMPHGHDASMILMHEYRRSRRHAQPFDLLLVQCHISVLLNFMNV
jgi:hypothetical protein